MHPETITTSSSRLTLAQVQSWWGALFFTALTALCAQVAVHIPPTPVPITMQVLAVFLSGLILGPRWGFVAQLQYVALGAVGAPVFALWHSGLWGPSAGYLLAFPLAAWVVGWFTKKKEAGHWHHLLACSLSLLLIYSFGCTWLAFSTHPFLSPLQAFIEGAGWFLVYDAFKAFLAITISLGWRRWFVNSP